MPPLLCKPIRILIQMRIHIVLISILLASCSLFPTFSTYKVEIRQGNLITADMRAKIKPGMTQSQVKAALGAPLITDPYHADRWDYFYSLDQQGKLVGSQRITLYFDKDVLKRIDDATPLLAPEPAKQE
jgi:outer membrane protein assembly factor BamE